MLAHDPLRVSLSDLLSASTKGKWWLVGAAWSGNPLVDAQTDPNIAEQKKLREVEANGEDELMKLARKQGMNTDVRRRVFVVIMGSSVSCRIFSREQRFIGRKRRRSMRNVLTTFTFSF